MTAFWPSANVDFAPPSRPTPDRPASEFRTGTGHRGEFADTEDAVVGSMRSGPSLTLGAPRRMRIEDTRLRPSRITLSPDLEECDCQPPTNWGEQDHAERQESGAPCDSRSASPHIPKDFLPSARSLHSNRISPPFSTGADTPRSASLHGVIHTAPFASRAAGHAPPAHPVQAP
jgi:hypothetical protein